MRTVGMMGRAAFAAKKAEAEEWRAKKQARYVV